MRIRLHLRTLAGLIFLCGQLASSQLLGGGAIAAPTSAPHEAGTWQKHEYSFAFMGFTSTYSCDGLASKLQLLLIASGARPDAKAQPGACAAGLGRPDKFARANLTFYTLNPAGSGAAAATTEKPDDATPDGHWIPVQITAHRPRELGTGDCELVEQFISSVLPMFTTRNLENHTTCVPHQISGSVIDLKFESFTGPHKKGKSRTSS